jgi:hypothetical protein
MGIKINEKKVSLYKSLLQFVSTITRYKSEKQINFKFTVVFKVRLSKS